MVASCSLIWITTTYLTNMALKIFLLFPLLLCVLIKSDGRIPSQCCILHNGLHFFDVLLCNYFRAKLFFWVWVCPWNLCVGNFVLCRVLMMGGEASGRRMNHESPAFLNGTTHSWTERVLRQWQRELAILRKGWYKKLDWPVFISVLPHETRLETL